MKAFDAQNSTRVVAHSGRSQLLDVCSAEALDAMHSLILN